MPMNQLTRNKYKYIYMGNVSLNVFVWMFLFCSLLIQNCRFFRIFQGFQKAWVFCWIFHPSIWASTAPQWRWWNKRCQDVNAFDWFLGMVEAHDMFETTSKMWITFCERQCLVRFISTLYCQLVTPKLVDLVMESFPSIIKRCPLIRV